VAGNSCLSLISSGAAEDAASFLDSSESGDDVFFLSSARLSVQDEDGVADVYDARVNGVVAVSRPGNECLGEACRPTPDDLSAPEPSSSTFVGPGNVHRGRRHCAKGKHRVSRRGRVRCVPRKHRGHRRTGKPVHSEGKVGK